MGQQVNNRTAANKPLTDATEAWLDPCSILARPGAGRAAYSGPKQPLFLVLPLVPWSPKLLHFVLL